ncbi:MAG TPA: DUF1330 domain-containing protein [Cellvibrio sp.]|nr:DUF1330 domain-containing protein [Cellvibrio sp.]
MKHLAVIETNITDASWCDDYVKNVTPMLVEYGGRYLTRSPNITLLEGSEKPQFSIVAEFPSKEAALNFYDSAAYAPYKTVRLRGSTSKFMLVAVENATE